MVAVRRDIDRYSDRESKSEAIFCIEQKSSLRSCYTGCADAREYASPQAKSLCHQKNLVRRR
jgi:hypothetical protein